MDSNFKLFQKALKYGLPNSLSISIYEKGFSDRCVAIQMCDELNSKNYQDLFWGESFEFYRYELEETLKNYPSYFQSVLDSL